MHDFISEMTAFIGFYEGKLFFVLLTIITIATCLIITKRKTYEPRSFLTQLVLVLYQVMYRRSVLSP